MKITLEVPDNTRAMVVTTIFGVRPEVLRMNTTNVSTYELKDGAIINAMPEVSDEEQRS